MIINDVLNELFRTRSNIMVLRALKDVKSGFTGREIARRAGLSAKNCLITLTSLEDMAVIKRIRGGRDHIFTLNREHFLVQNIIIPALQQELRYQESIEKTIVSALSKLVVSLYIFGSVARSEEKMESDLDLCIVYNTKSEKNILDDKVDTLISILKMHYGVVLAPYFISKNSFISKLRANKPPVNEIAKESKHLFGIKMEKLNSGKKNYKKVG